MSSDRSSLPDPEGAASSKKKDKKNKRNKKPRSLEFPSGPSENRKKKKKRKSKTPKKKKYLTDVVELDPDAVRRDDKGNRIIDPKAMIQVEKDLDEEE